MTEPIAPIEQTRHPNTKADASRENTHLPRITITYCTQCKWMLRAAYFAQELLSTFGTTIGEVSLRPATGGIFTVTIVSTSSTEETLLWDRKTNGGFPEVKQLKALVRNIVDPTRDLGHVDRALNKANKDKEDSTVTKSENSAEKQQVGADATAAASTATQTDEKEEDLPLKPQEPCEDCQ
ncbi:selenoprotein domain protein [Talaromyces stipitatus ATCC 10500]|uniref:Selenoprotein domain protein n=1 Tax=Talaromyces stipitatus (strain ATCC 10500 / CBS 375.48 / QM 6759 / NRRL 1006) TaxID=441959 RepID=B8MH53_TALSN|nr:selenoprotein domain protein [Talaromyces stipitatus ATCC 10500]EED16867.1 selenoprotein domain protein [Talaromyces stipitatus ATCC 10500]